MDFIKSKACKSIIVVLGTVTVFIPVIFSFWQGINVDSAVILSEMERISDGFVPYKTLHLNYPPLYFYICVGLKWLLHVKYGCYPLYLAINYLFLSVTTFFVYKICRIFECSKQLSWFSSWLFLMIILTTQGNYVLFEMPSICFGLAAMYYCISFKDKKFIHYIWFGALASCSFLVKQFGAGFYVLGLYVIIAFNQRGKWQRILNYTIGYSIPILICYMVWGTDFFNSVLFNGYGTETAAQAGYDVSITGKLRQIIANMYRYCIFTCPIVISAFAAIPTIIRNDRTKEYLFCLFGIIGFSLNFWFAGGSLHYTQYMTPFAATMIPMIIQCDKTKRLIMWLTYTATSVTIVIALFSSIKYGPYKVLTNKTLNQQKEISARLSRKIGEKKNIWIVNIELEYLYYLNNLMPPNMATVGYATGNLEATKEKQLKQIKSAEYVIILSKQPSSAFLIDDEILSYLKQYPSDTLDEKGEILIHKMSIE